MKHTRVQIGSLNRRGPLCYLVVRVFICKNSCASPIVRGIRRDRFCSQFTFDRETALFVSNRDLEFTRDSFLLLLRFLLLLSYFFILFFFSRSTNALYWRCSRRSEKGLVYRSKMPNSKTFGFSFSFFFLLFLRSSVESTLCKLDSVFIKKKET